jgi:1-acyl-sn-glycerol-3-phosphate acyltransferase
MIYRLLRWIAGISLHWFYREIRIIGQEKIPADGPLLIAVNHQNALVDSLIVGWVMPRRVTMTGKATLIDNPLIAALFKILGVVPLRRVSDEAQRSDGRQHDHSRNSSAFGEILNTLQKAGAVLIFPEGKSHNEAGLEPLRSGMARLALQARDERSIRNVRILPIGLVFEDKGTPGSLVGVRVGESIDVDSWPDGNPAALTQQIADRLRSVSEGAVLHHPRSSHAVQSDGVLRHALITVTAAWGRVTHEFPVRIARKLAVKKSRDADQPAMLTIIFGIGLVLLAYVLQVAIVGVLVHSFWISSFYLATLLAGAYWAAFERHPQRH